MGELEDLRRENRKLRIVVKGLKQRIPPKDWRKERDALVGRLAELAEEVAKMSQRDPLGVEGLVRQLDELLRGMKRALGGDGLATVNRVMRGIKRGKKNVNMKVFALVTYAAARGIPITSWFLESEKAWVNDVGGYMPKCSDHVVLQRMEAEFFSDLSWDHLKVPDSQHGWMDPKGEFQGCLGTEKDQYAMWVLESSSWELKSNGWAWVNDGVLEGFDISEAQEEEATRRGFFLDEDEVGEAEDAL